MSTQSGFEAALAAELEWSKKDAQELLDLIADLVYKELKTGEPVTIRGLGRFKIAARAARMGRNPQTGEAIKIKASKKLKMLPAKPLRDRLRVK